MQNHRWDDVQDAVASVRARWSGRGRIGLILGTGLGKLASEIDAEAIIPYDEIPHFPRPTGVLGHSGQFVCGTLSGAHVVAMEGRFHLYEGFSPYEITFPIRVIKELGCDILIVSNAAGGLNPLHKQGDLVVIDDHINLPGLTGTSPLIGLNDERLGPRFPDMCQPYDRGLQELALSIALEEGIPAHRGVYVGIVGPNLETRAEYRYLRAIGADTVGMSTVSEVLVAVHAGMKVLGFSIVTDLCLADALQPVRIEEILAVANEAESKLRRIVSRVIERLPR